MSRFKITKVPKVDTTAKHYGNYIDYNFKIFNWEYLVERKYHFLWLPFLPFWAEEHKFKSLEDAEAYIKSQESPLYY